MKIPNAIRMLVLGVFLLCFMMNPLARNLIPFLTDYGREQRFGWPTTYFIRMAEIQIAPHTWLLTPAKHITWNYHSIAVFSMNIAICTALGLAFAYQLRDAMYRAARCYGVVRLVVLSVLFFGVFTALSTSSEIASNYNFGSPSGVLLSFPIYAFPFSLFLAICGLARSATRIGTAVGARNKENSDLDESEFRKNRRRRWSVAWVALVTIVGVHGVLHAALYKLPFDLSAPPAAVGVDRYGWPLAFVGLEIGDPFGLADFATSGVVVLYPGGCILDAIVIGVVSAVSATTICRVVSRLGYVRSDQSALLYIMLLAAVLLAEYNRFGSWAAPYPPEDVQGAVLAVAMAVTHTWYVVTSLSILQLFWWFTCCQIPRLRIPAGTCTDLRGRFRGLG